jgi:hypothetical protein
MDMRFTSGDSVLAYGLGMIGGCVDRWIYRVSMFMKIHYWIFILDPNWKFWVPLQ